MIFSRECVLGSLRILGPRRIPQRFGSNAFSSAVNINDESGHGEAKTNELFYTREHQWIKFIDTESNIVRFGLSSYGVDAIGDIVFVDLPKSDSLPLHVKAGDSLGAVESVKGAADIYAPLDGTYKVTNESVISKPILINKAPEMEGWF